MHNEEIVLETENTKVRVIELSANVKAPWHHHTEVTDNFFCLHGNIEIHIKNPDQVIPLKSGGRCKIEAETVHRVVNNTKEQAKYLLVQGVGKYDFIESDQ